MGDKRHRPPTAAAPDLQLPAATRGASGGGSLLDRVGSVTGPLGSVMTGVTGAQDLVSGVSEGDAVTAVGGSLSLVEGVADLAQRSKVSEVAGTLGTGLGVITGAKDALDGSLGARDRVVGGLDGVTSGLQLGAQFGGHGGLFAAGGGVGGASTLASSSATAALGAGGAASMAAGGAVIGAGVAGWKAGEAINAIAQSRHAKQAPGAVGGTHQTYASWWQDAGARIGGPAGVAVGTAGATFGTLADAGVASWNAVSGLFNRPSGGKGNGGKPAPRGKPVGTGGGGVSKPSGAPRGGRPGASPSPRAGAKPTGGRGGSTASASGKRPASGSKPSNDSGGFWGSVRRAVGWDR